MKYPILFDEGHKEYQRKNIKKNAWKEIGNDMINVNPIDRKCYHKIKNPQE